MLQKAIITIPLGLGVNTKQDEKLVEQGSFNLVAENASFDKVGAVKKRQSFEDMSSTYYTPGVSDGTGSGNYTALTYKPTMSAAYGPSALLRNQVGQYLYSYGDNFVYKGTYPLPEAKITSKRLYSSKSSAEVTDCDYDPNEGIVVFTVKNQEYGTNKATVCMVLYDTETEETIKTPHITNGGAFGALGPSRVGWTRVSGVSYYYHIYVNNAVLYVDVFNKYGQTFSSFTQINMAARVIGVCRDTSSATFYIIGATTTGTSARFVSMSGSSSVSNAAFTVSSSAWGSSTARFDSAATRVNFVYSTGGSVGRKVVLSTVGVVTTADTALSGCTGVTQVGYFQEEEKLVVYHSSTGAIATYNVGTATLTIENDLTTPVSDVVSIGGVKISQTCPYLAFTGALTPYFVQPVETTFSGAKILGRYLNTLAPVLGLSSQLSRMAKIDDNTAVYCAVYLSDNDGNDIVYNAALVFVEINQDYKSNSRAINGANLHLCGGHVSEFDGDNIIESGFHIQAPAPVLTQVATGNLTGQYAYCIVFRYTDRNGQVTRSEPSVIVSPTVAAADSYQVDMQSTPYGFKFLDCVVEVYRTLAGGSTFYLSLEIPANMYTGINPWVAGTVIDNNSDAGISNNRILYTSGNVLSNNPGPACKHISQWGNRVICVGLEDENEFAYSKEKLFGECVNFSDFFRGRVDTAQFNTTGGLTAGSGMDDKFILFKRNSIFYISGQGPNELGVGDFTSPSLVSAETGCTDPRSVVLSPKGVMFKGDKGIYLLSRGMETMYIGAPIESYNSYQVTSAVHIDKKNIVSFTLSNGSDGVIATYDYFTEQWSVIPDKMCLDSDLLVSDMVILPSGNIPATQTGTDFTDNSVVYSTKIKTPWIKVSGIQDFGRMWSATILGKYKSEHTLSVNVKYDYDETYVESYEIEPEASDSQYEYRIHLRKQKCVAVQFEIFDSNQTGESMELTALSLECGLKKGSAKLSASRKY